MKEILTEIEMIDYFAIADSKDRSRIISSWIGRGLKYVELSGARFYLREDVLGFFRDNRFKGTLDGV